jgi:hypothetical protein
MDGQDGADENDPFHDRRVVCRESVSAHLGDQHDDENVASARTSADRK